MGTIDCSCATDDHDDGGLIKVDAPSALDCDNGLYVVTEDFYSGALLPFQTTASVQIDPATNALYAPIRVYGVDGFGRSTADIEGDFNPRIFYPWTDSEAASMTTASSITGVASTVTMKNAYTLATGTGHWILPGTRQMHGLLARIDAQVEITLRTSRTPSATTDGDGIDVRLRLSENGATDITIAFDRMIIKDHQRTLQLRAEFWRYLNTTDTFDFHLEVTRLGTNNGAVVGVRKAWAAYRQC